MYQRLSVFLWSTTDNHLLREPCPTSLNEFSDSACWWADREEHREQGDSLRVSKKQQLVNDIVLLCSWVKETDIYPVGAAEGDG